MSSIEILHGALRELLGTDQLLILRLYALLFVTNLYVAFELEHALIVELNA